MPLEPRAPGAAGGIPAAQDEDAVLDFDPTVPVELEDEPGSLVGGAVTEVGGNIAGEVLAGVLEKKFKAKGLAKAAKNTTRFLTGVGSSMLAQRVEGEEDISPGRTVAAGLANLFMPFRSKKGAFALSPVARVAAQGTVIGGTERALADLIDEGKISPRNIAIAAGTGLGVGTVLGKGIYRFSDADRIATLIGKNQEEIDELINDGKVRKEELNALLSEALGRPITQRELDKSAQRMIRENVAKSLQSSKNPLADSYKSFLNTVAPTLGKAGRFFREDYLDFVALREQAEALSTRLQRSIDNVAQNKPELAQDINEYMRGGELSDALSEEAIVGDLMAFRDIEIQQMKALRDILQDSKELDFLPKEGRDIVLRRMQEMIDKGKRQYDSSFYRAFTMKEYVPKMKEQEVLQEVQDSLIANGFEEDDAIKLAEKHLKHLKSMFASQAAKKKARLAFLPGRLESVIEGHAPGPKERSFLGEIDDPIIAPGIQARFRIRDSIRHLADMESDVKLLKGLREADLVSDVPREGYIKLVLKSVPFPKGKEVYVPMETADAITKLYELGLSRAGADAAAGLLRQIFGAAVGLSKAVKVVMNPPSYMVNFYGGVLSAASNGVLPSFNNIRSYQDGFGLAMKEFHKIYDAGLTKGGVGRISDPEIRRRITMDVAEMYKYGIGNASVAANEVADAINNGRLGDFMRKTLEPFGKAYNLTDTATRFTIWKHNQRMLKQKLQGQGVNITEDQVKKIAADMTNDTYQNYARTNRFARMLSRNGVMPPFVTFTLELARNTGNQVKLIRNMINGDAFAAKYGIELTPGAKAAIQAEGFKRFAYLGSVLGLSMGAGSVVPDFLRGEGERVSPDDMEDYRFFLPEYARDQDIIASFDPNTKNGTFAMTSYLFPHATLTQILGAAKAQALDPRLNPEDEAPVRNAMSLVIENLVGEGTFVGKNLYRALDNRDINGKVITNKEGAAAFKELLLNFTQETFKPGAFNEAEKLVRAMRGRGDYSMGEILARQAGARLTKTNLDQMAKYRVQDFARRYSEARGKYTTNLKYNPKGMGPEEMERSYQEAIAEGKAAFERMQEAYNRLDPFGYTQDEKIKILREGGVRSQDVFRIVRGMDYEPFKRGLVRTTGEMYTEAVAGKDPSEIKRYFRELSRGTPEERIMSSRLSREYNRRINDERKGRTEEDRLLLNMSILERADMLIAMGANMDRALYREMRRKGIINKDVRAILRGR